MEPPALEPEAQQGFTTLGCLGRIALAGVLGLIAGVIVAFAILTWG